VPTLAPQLRACQIALHPYDNAVSALTEEIAEICEALPAEKRAALAEFARFLLAGKESSGDIAWERILADQRPRPKLEAFLREAAAEGADEPLDLRRL